MDVHEIVEKQQAFFQSKATLSLEFRLEMLRKLQNSIIENKIDIEIALIKDMNKCKTEVYMTEIGIILNEIRFHIKNLKQWMKNKKVLTPSEQLPAKSFISPHPLGVVLIMSPWNYPVQLSLEPLVGAISAGCTAILKPSSYTTATSKILAKILMDTYPAEYITTVLGGREENSNLLKQKFDHIFFTGSPKVGHLVMESAAKNLTPVTLELGGKSPVIVDHTANISIAAKRIAFGKILNAGQTCVAPDYLFIHKSVKEEFVSEYKSTINQFFPNGDMSDMNIIINDYHFKRIKSLMDSGNILIGGETDDEKRFIAPTLLDNVAVDSPIMQEEIFGPILPMMTFTDLNTCIDYINNNPKPLALYLFTTDNSVEKKVLDSCTFGGGCINDTIIHIATPHMGFGGVGSSGIGSYHGKKSFDTFTHYRSIVKKSNIFDLPVRYRPYSSFKNRVISFFLK